MRHLFALPFVFALLAVVNAALAQPQATDSESPNPRSGEAVAVANAAGKDQQQRYDEKLREALARGAARDWEGAAVTLRDAIELRSGPAEGHILLGEVYRLQRKFAESERTLRLGVDRAHAQQKALWEARAMASLATTLEAQGELQRAREIWIEVARFGDSNGNATPIQPHGARARIQAIDLVFEREHVYIDVRQRISDRERVNGGKP